MDRLRQQFQYYRDNRSDFVGEYDGRVIALKDNAVLGVYDDEFIAVAETEKEHELGTFIVQRVSSDEEANAVTFYTPRVSFC